MSNITKKYVDYAGLQTYDSQIKGVISTDFVGATSSSDGVAGRVPAPESGDEKKFMRGDGTWALTPSEIYVGTATAWGQLTLAQKAQYKVVVLDE